MICDEQECREYWDRLPERKRIRYFTELRCDSHLACFDMLQDLEKEKVVKHIKRLYQNCSKPQKY